MCITIGYGAFALHGGLWKTMDERGLIYKPTVLKIVSTCELSLE